MAQEKEISLREIAKENFAQWNEALQTKDPTKVAQMYLPEKGQLFGTVSAEIRNGRERVAGYFEHFLKSDPSGKVINRKVKFLGEDAYVDQGDYVFMVTKGGESVEIEAAFLYVWEKDEDGQWKIRFHHSLSQTERNRELAQTEGAVDLDDEENIEWGINEEIGEGIFLKTGFYQPAEGPAIRFSYVLAGDGIVHVISEKPDGSSGV